ncbi:MAG: hypothetical protein HYR84_14560 [Planctomycetes bacterium]|nr:hypothetical protein [Planctomycetota bacterium]
MNLPKPKIVRCFFDETFGPALPVMELCWPAMHAGAADHTWHLPEGVSIKGPAPRRFGVTIHRTAGDAYQVRILWNAVCMSWARLTRRQIMASSLAALLASLETDLWDMLHQPVDEGSVVQAA